MSYKPPDGECAHRGVERGKLPKHAIRNLRGGGEGGTVGGNQAPSQRDQPISLFVT